MGGKLRSYSIRLISVLSILAVSLMFAVAGCGGDNSAPIPIPTATINPSTPSPSPTPTSSLSGTAIQGPMQGSTITAFAVNTSTGASGTQLGTTTTATDGSFTLTITPQTGPVRLTAAGGTYGSEMNGAQIDSTSQVSVLLPGANANISGISINPLSTFIDTRTVALVNGGTAFNSALTEATKQIEAIYGLKTDPGVLLPDYKNTGTDAANLGLVLGAIINEDQAKCPGSPGGLAAALAADISDGVFDGLKAGQLIPYCGANLPAVAGTSAFQDALSGLQQLQLVTRAFAFGGTGNILTANGLANIATGGTAVYPLAPLATINAALRKAAPSPVNSFAPAGQTATMNTARDSATATLLPSGKVLIAGGVKSFGSVLSSTDLYDPAPNIFAPVGQTANMNIARTGATATLLPNGKVLIAGGVGLGRFLASTELYDPTTNSFAPANQTAIMNIARAGASATLLPNGKVLIAGGVGSYGVLASTDLYDPATNTFASRNRTMNAARTEATATLLPNGKVLIAGGLDSYAYLASTELYDPTTDSFAPASQTASMNTARYEATAILLPNGKVLIAGGYNNLSGFLASTELYDPTTNSFAPASQTAGMNATRAYATATLLPNGKVLIAGGLGSSGFLATTELYDPATNTFAPAGQTASMNAAPAGASATLLRNGKILIAGGLNPTAGFLASTELYTP